MYIVSRPVRLSSNGAKFKCWICIYVDINFIHDSLPSKVASFGQFCLEYVHFLLRQVYFSYYYFVLKWFSVDFYVLGPGQNSDMCCIFHKLSPNNFRKWLIYKHSL